VCPDSDEGGEKGNLKREGRRQELREKNLHNDQKRGSATISPGVAKGRN